MKLDELIKLLEENKHYLFSITIPNSSFTHGRTGYAQALADAPTLKDYFERIILANGAKQLFVELYTPNGSSYKNRGKHLIFLDSTGPVATNATNATKVEDNATNVATKTQSSLQGIEEEYTPKTKTMNSTDMVGYEVLKVRHELLQGAHDTLKKEHEDLRKKVDRLQDEKLDLVKENSVNKEKNELELARVKFNAEKDAKDGLAGVMDYVNDNPDTVKMILGAIFPNNPNFNSTGNAPGTTKVIEPITYHDDKDINALLVDMPNTIKELDGAKIAMIYAIFNYGFAKDPNTIDKVWEVLFPGKAKPKQ